MRKVLIIGCGYLGSHLANYYCQHGWHVKIAGKKSLHKEFLYPQIEFYEIDIRDTYHLQSVIEKEDVVINAAGSINATNSFWMLQEISMNTIYPLLIYLMYVQKKNK